MYIIGHNPISIVVTSFQACAGCVANAFYISAQPLLHSFGSFTRVTQNKFGCHDSAVLCLGVPVFVFVFVAAWFAGRPLSGGAPWSAPSRINNTVYGISRRDKIWSLRYGCHPSLLTPSHSVTLLYKKYIKFCDSPLYSLLFLYFCTGLRSTFLEFLCSLYDLYIISVPLVTVIVSDLLDTTGV